MGTARHKQTYLDNVFDQSAGLPMSYYQAREDRNVLAEGLRDLERTVSSYEQWTLMDHLDMALNNHDSATVQYLLGVGVRPQPFKLNEILQFNATGGLREAALPVAVLLRKYGSPLAPDDLRIKVENWIVHFSAPRRHSMPSSKRILKQLKDILDPPQEERAKLAVYHYADFDPSTKNPEIVQSWPTDPMRAGVVWAEHSPFLKSLSDTIRDLWDGIRALRRAEAKVLAPFNWRRLRLLIKMRAIAFYWMEETQKRVCAPGGTGRAADLAAYRAAFA